MNDWLWPGTDEGPPPSKRLNFDRFVPRKASPVNFRLPNGAVGEYEANLQSLFPREERPATPTGSNRKVLLFGSQCRSAEPSARKRTARQFDPRELKVLDAPGLADCFYLNLLSFSTTDELAVGLGSDLHLFGFNATRSRLLYTDTDGCITSVRFARQNASAIAFGAANGVLRVADAADGALLRQFPAEDGRIAALDWNGELVAAGTRRGQILLRDLRLKGAAALALSPHSHEVCALAFNPFNDRELLSGGNDDAVVLSDLRALGREAARFAHHRAAVKAICWHPTRRGLFASGGGARDRRLCVVDAYGGVLREAALSGQICNVGFNCEGQLLAATGAPLFALQVLDTQSLETLQAFTGHCDRPLFMAVARDGAVAATGSPDQTIRYWNVCAGRARPSANAERGAASPLRSF